MQREWIARLSEAMVGLLFGWGLLLAGMTDPGKVMGFFRSFRSMGSVTCFSHGWRDRGGVVCFSLCKKTHA